MVLILSFGAYAVYALVIPGKPRDKNGKAQDVLESIVVKRQNSQAMLDREREIERLYYLHRAASRKLS